MDFTCINDCSQCCIEREYYPSKRFGKVGVLILPEEKDKIESTIQTRSQQKKNKKKEMKSIGTQTEPEVD